MICTRRGAVEEEGGDGGGCTQCVRGRSRMTIDPRIPTMPGRNTSGFHIPSGHLLAPSAKRREVFGRGDRFIWLAICEKLGLDQVDQTSNGNK